MLLTQQPWLGLVPSVPYFFRVRIIDVSEINQSGQWLENVDRTHLVLARGKLVLQTKKTWPTSASLGFLFQFSTM